MQNGQITSKILKPMTGITPPLITGSTKTIQI